MPTAPSISSPSTAKAPGVFSKATLWIVIGTVVVVVVLGALFASRIPSEFIDPSTLPQKVSLQTLTLEPIEAVYDTQGTLEAANRIDMNVETAGTVTEIRFDEGVNVRQGQVLLSLRADKQQAQAAEAAAGIQSAEDMVLARQADVTRAEADLHAAQSNYRLALSEYKRYRELFETELISALERDQKRNAAETAKAAVVSAEKRLNQARVEVQQAQSQTNQAQARLGYNQALASETTIRAPFTGTIGEKYIDVGDYVIPGEKILTLADNRSMKVAFSVPERYGPNLTEGSPVSVSLSGLDQPLNGYVVFIDPVVDLQNRTIKVKALLETPKGIVLRDGQFGQVRLVTATKPEGLKVPEEAVVPQGEKFFVYRAVRDEKGKLKAKLTQIQVGERDTGWAEVLSGVNAGETIATSGLKKLFDGALIAEPNQTKPGQLKPNPQGR